MQQKINGVLINYEYVKRSEQTILFLHGWGGSLNSFKGAFNYFLNNSNYSLLNLDLPSFGKSEEPPQNFTIYSYYDLVLNLVKNLNINNLHIVAHSFGGRIAIILSVKNASMVKSLTLVASAGIKPKKSLKTWFKIIKYKIYKKCCKNKQKLSTMGSTDYKKLSQTMKKVFVNIVNEDLSYLLKHIKCPCLIYWARDDNQTPYYMAKKLKNKINNSGIVLLKNGGHFAYLNNHNHFVKTTKFFINNYKL